MTVWLSTMDTVLLNIEIRMLVLVILCEISSAIAIGEIMITLEVYWTIAMGASMIMLEID